MRAPSCALEQYGSRPKLEGPKIAKVDPTTVIPLDDDFGEF